MDSKVLTSPSHKTSSFYTSKPSKGSKAWIEKQAKWQAKCEEFQKKPIPAPRLLRLDDPIPVFQRFPLQQLATDFARSCNKDVHIFSEEIDSNGKRRYLVSTCDQFWQFYRKLQPEQRHYYEVITEGSACKLYFDLEFKKDLNPGSNGTEMLNIWIKYVCYQINELFGINCDRKHIIDLDSSTEIKFSRHLIFCLPGSVFKDNIHVGNFVNHICASLLNLVHNCNTATKNDIETENQTIEDPQAKRPCKSDGILTDKLEKQTRVSLDDLKKLLVNNNKGETVTFCDQGVYTKNRNFRLFKSTKYGKMSTLELSKENTFKSEMKKRTGSFSRDHNYVLFLDSMICNVSYSDGNNHDVRILTFESETKPGKRPRLSNTSSFTSSQELIPSGYEHSPYPQIDDFISTVINKGDVAGKIRRWVYFPQGKILMYDIDKNRWCENIGRAHKSNHIIMVADMRQGVYYQKCHDPECRRINYRSQEKPIPEDVNPFLQEKAFLDSGVWEDEEDDDILCQVAEEAEINESFTENECQQNDDSDIFESHFAPFLDDDSNWEPWKDLPVCEPSVENN